MTSSALRVSVVIPTYNRAAKLRQALRSLAVQSAAPGTFEVVVVDDGSTDTTSTVVEQLRPELPETMPVRYITASHRGPGAARNTGIEQAAAPVILFMDDDCEADQAFVATHAAETAAPGTVTIGRVVWNPGLTVTPFMDLVTRGAQFNLGAITDPDAAPFSCFYTCNVSVTRADLDAVGGFDEGLPPYGEDTELGYRLSCNGVRMRYRPQAVVHHHHPLELCTYLQRQRRAGRAAVQLVARHPELRSALDIDAVADVRLREQFYTTLLRYAFILGVENALLDEPESLSTETSVTGSDLRSRFEGWVSESASKIAAEAKATEERVRQLEAHVDARDARFAHTVQEKDARIAALEAELRRYQRLWPLRLLHFLRRRFRS